MLLVTRLLFVLLFLDMIVEHNQIVSINLALFTKIGHFLQFLYKLYIASVYRVFNIEYSS